MPKHADGIDVCIHQLNGAEYKEYNNPYFKRPDDFNGSVASRLIGGQAGHAFEVRIVFDRNFKPFNATGVEIAIAIGGVTDRLSWDDNSQTFFIKLNKADLPCEHRFTYFTAWESHDDPDSQQLLHMQVPEPDRKSTYLCLFLNTSLLTCVANAATASTAWLLDTAAFEANPGCISVFVVRGSLVGHAQRESNITNPPVQIR